MLRELRVENYAVIDHAVVEFGPGLNLLTGETGAGKSILIDALTLLLGEKASSDVIRHGADKAVISCVFEAEGDAAERILEKNGIESAGTDNDIILKREIMAGGKGRVFINNQPATVGVLKQLAPELASVHAQNETLQAFDGTIRLKLLDRFAGIDRAPLRQAFQAWQELAQRIAELERSEQEQARMLDLWSFQNKEIDSAHIEPGEDQKLEAEKRLLANSERVYTAAMATYDALYAGATSADSSLRTAQKHLEELARYDERFREPLTLLETARAYVQDASMTARDFADGIDASPDRLAQVEDRLALLSGLKRKYGSSIEEVLSFGEDLARKLSEIENRDEILRGLRTQLDAAAEAYLKVAGAASKQRSIAARKLQKLVEEHINDLAMKARFQIEVAGSEAQSQWGPSGFDEVQFLIATNAGEPLKPMDQIASGGELSRSMLALKVSIEQGGAGLNGDGSARKNSRKSPIQRTLVFDEIDTGIGGRAAEAVGQKLKTLAKANQVLCITHLPQIASFADLHFVIEKREHAGRARTGVRLLSNSEQTEEIARMLSGATLTEASIKNAEQMLKMAKTLVIE